MGTTILVRDVDILPDDHPVVRKHGYIYFMRAGKRKLVKIGWSKNVKQRWQDLQTSMPDELKIVFVIECDDAPGYEKHLHKKFSDLRVRGEWFKLEDEIVRMIADHAGHTRRWCSWALGIGPDVQIPPYWCEVCDKKKATHAHVVPWICKPTSRVVLACRDCDPGGYWFPIKEWSEPLLAGSTMKEHISRKRGGWEMVELISGTLGRD